MTSYHVTQMFHLAEHYGLRSECGQLVEEMAELMQALNKYDRALGNGQPTNLSPEKALCNIAEEIADVQVVLNQIQHLLHISQESIVKIKEEKIDRSVVRMKAEGLIYQYDEN